VARTIELDAPREGKSFFAKIAGRLSLHTVVFPESDEDDASFMVSYADHRRSIGSESTDPRTSFLSWVRRNAERDQDVKLVKSGEITLGSIQGLWQQTEASGPSLRAICYDAVFLVENRFYWLSVVADKDHFSQENVDIFAKSFRPLAQDEQEELAVVATQKGDGSSIADTFVEVSSEMAGMRILFPAEPQRSEPEQSGTSPAQWSYVYEDPSSGTVYSAAAAKLTFDEPVSARERLDGARDGMLARTGARLLEETAFEQQGFPGRRCQLKGEGRSEGFRTSTQLVVTDERLFILMVIAKDKSPPQQATSEFFASFRLLF
jgi:hypothetical protein